MKVTYNWLKDFVSIKLKPQALADKLTMAGLEVVSLEEKSGDWVFEIEITSNRPDWLSVIGIAREIAAITGSKLKAPDKTPFKAQKGKLADLKIEIHDKKDCYLYSAKIIEGVKVEASPEWLRKRLESIGCRSVNNIVDITNYILFTFGEPLHAFDLDKLAAGQIIVRRAKSNEKFSAIDGSEKTLNPEILVIADKNKALAAAGIMGGKDSEVGFATRNILLEAAVFNPIVMRRGRQKLGFSTESSYRFERGIDIEIVEPASIAAAALIQEIAGGNCRLAKSSGIPKLKKKSIALDISRMNSVLGTDISLLEAKRDLGNLGFQVKQKAAHNLSVTIPSHRADVNLEVDLIEEVARIFGYDRIPQSLPCVRTQVLLNPQRDFIDLVRQTLVGLGLNEAITYTLTDKSLLESFIGPDEPPAIEILNPLSQDQEILRPHLIPSLARCIAYNLNQKEEYINIFEISHVFSGDKASVKEGTFLGIGLCGSRAMLMRQGLVRDEVSLLHLKGILESLFMRVGIKDYAFSAINAQATAISIGKEPVGLMLKLRKAALDRLQIKNKDVFALELSLEKMFKHVNLDKTFQGLPRYPAIVRDTSIIVREGTAVKELLAAMQEKGQPLLRQARIVDYYQGQQIPPGTKSITISCLYRSDDKTLTEAEINPLHSAVCRVLTERFSAKMR